MTPEELAQIVHAFGQNIEPVAQLAAECYEEATKIAHQNELLPDCYLACQWIVWSHALRSRTDPTSTDCALASLRSIALCMRATGFSKSEKYLEVITTITETYRQIVAMKQGEQA